MMKCLQKGKELWEQGGRDQEQKEKKKDLMGKSGEAHIKKTGR